MGFFDKVKAMKNTLTGGAAKVYIECDEISFTEPFKVTVRADIDSSNLIVDRIYLKIEGNEEIEVPDVDVAYDSNGEEHRRLEIVTSANTTVSFDITVAYKQELEANQSYEWEVEVELPEDAPRVYHGHFCQHTYSAFAGLECFGNDPDSGWLELPG